jgi:gamma-glutamylcyclotransferase (GGCT)/AIG2-like uncharacterized protein YtfP
LLRRLSVVATEASGAATVPTYNMIENGFPVIMPDPEGKPITGEIYTVDDETLARLDRLEREGSSYDRKLIDVTLPLASGERCRPRRSYTLDAKIALAKHSLAARSVRP